MEIRVDKQDFDEDKRIALGEYLRSDEFDVDYDRVVVASHVANDLQERICSGDSIQRKFTDLSEYEDGEEPEMISRTGELLNDEDTLYILCFASASDYGERAADYEQTKLNGKSYELARSERDGYLHDEEEYFDTIEDDKENPIGQMSKNHIICYFDLTHASSNGNEEIVCDFIKHALELRDEMDELKTLDELQRQKLREKFQEEKEAKIEELEEELDEKHQSYEEHLEKVVNLSRKMKTIDQLLNDYLEEELTLDDIIEKIDGHSRVTDYNITGEGLEVITDDLSIDNTSIGQYKIIFKLGGGLSVYHLPRIDGCQHPHVSSSGSPCLGNYSSVVENIKNFEFGVALDIMITFLEDYNEHDPHISLGDWLDRHF